MKWTLLPWAFAPALLAPLFVPDNASAHSGLMRVPGQSAVGTVDLSVWKDRLTVRDLDQRERAFDEFVDVLRRDGELRRAVVLWRDGSDADLAWTTRLALRESRDSSNGSAPRTPFQGRFSAPNDMRSQLDDMQRQFGDLDRMFEDFQQRLDQQRQDQQRSSGGFAPQRFAPPGTREQHQSYSMQVTPDGVKVEIEENVDGKIEKKTYEAKTLEEVYDAHPELKDKVGARVQMHSGPGARWQHGDSDFLFGTPRQGPGVRSLAPLPLPPPLALQRGVATDRLGVRIDEMTEADHQSRALDADVGLKVASIEDHSIAEKIGIEPGDVIVEINGRVVKGAPDVLETLAQRKPDQDVSVTVVDSDGKKRVLTWRAPSAKPLGAAREF